MESVFLCRCESELTRKDLKNRLAIIYEAPKVPLRIGTLEPVSSRRFDNARRRLLDTCRVCSIASNYKTFCIDIGRGINPLTNTPGYMLKIGHCVVPDFLRWQS